MKNPTTGFLAILLLSAFQVIIQAQTTIPGGDVSGTWTQEGSPYLILDNIIIPEGGTLILEPGVVAEFQGHYSLSVQGRLLCEGTAADTILFTVNDTTGFHDPHSEGGGWGSIRFIDTPSSNDSSLFTYCRFQFGKAVGDVWHLNAGGALCMINFGKIRISHCLFTHNSAGGSFEDVPAGGAIHAAWSNILLTNNTFAYNYARTGGAIQIHESRPLFTGNLYMKNSAETGGAIACGGPVDLSFEGDQFINNTAESHGGGLMCWTANSIIFSNVLFSGNAAGWGGGLGIFGTVTSVSNSTFENNLALNIGGGMAADFCELTIEGCTFVNDSSASISGALHNWHCNTVINDCDFQSNSALLGGAVYSDFSSAAITNTLFTGNRANNGGALRYWCSNLVADQVLFTDNHAYYESGALEFLIDTNEFSDPYEISLTNTIFQENRASFRYGAVLIQQYNSDQSLVQAGIDRCEFYNNNAERIGALQINGNISGATISNSIFSGNTSDLVYACASFVGGTSGMAANTLFIYNEAGSGTAGALGIANFSSFDFINCTFAGNASPMGGAISLRRGSTCTLVNDIFWGNSPSQLVMNAVTDTTPCAYYIYHCDVQDGKDSIIVLDTLVSFIDWGIGNIADQPLFKDILNVDFTLSDVSPCLGAGVDSIQIDGTWYFAPATDLHGNPRPDPPLSKPDLGCLESPLAGPMGTDNKRTDPNSLLLEISPNPFSEHTHIRIRVATKVLAGIRIYNSLGELVDSFPAIVLSPGDHAFEWKANGLKGGIYYILLSAGKRTAIKKAMLIR